MKIFLNKRKLTASFFCMAAFLFAVTVAAAPKKMAKPSNTFTTPDFAFPKTVEKNANEQLAEALKSKDGLKALQAAIQLDVASGLVDAASCKESLSRFDSLANVLPVPFNSLALLLEATLYRDIYSSSSWKFNRRLVPLNPKSSDVLEWSRDQFADTVNGLVTRSLADEAALAALPLADIKPLLADADDALNAGFTVADFMTVRAYNVLSRFTRGNSEVIPFGDAKTNADPVQNLSLLRIEMLDNAIKRHSADADKQIEAFFCGLKLQCYNGSERDDYLKKCLDRFLETRWGASFLVDYCNSLPPGADEDRNSVVRRRYKMLTDYREAFPDAPQIGVVNAAIDDLLSKNVNVNYQSQVLPGRPVKVSVSGANVYDFYLLAYRVKGTDRSKRVRYSDISSLGAPLHAVHVKLSNVSPEGYDTIVDMPPLAPGLYTFVPSSAPKASGLLTQNRSSSVALTLVSDLAVVTASAQQGNPRDLYVVSAFNQQPVAGAKVTFTPQKNNARGTPVVKTTDRDGKVTIDNNQYDYVVRHGDSFIAGNLYKSYGSDRNSRESLATSVLTDLSVYRPGLEVKFSAIAYTELDNVLRMAPDRNLKVMLIDANGQETDSLKLKTDKFGRADGAFKIPDAGLLGRWGLHIYDNGDSSSPKWLTGEGFEVADYKSPTFYAAVNSSSSSFKAGDNLEFSGVATTYAGMPVADAKVAYNVRYVPMWRFSSMSDASYGGETVTGSDGAFSINLPTDGLVGTGYAFGSYLLSVTVTDAAGETQEAPALRFSLGNALRIESDMPDAVEVKGESESFNVTVRDLADHPVKKRIYYELSAGDKTVESGEFESPRFSLPLSDIESGRYCIRFSLTPDFRSSGERDVLTDSVTFWRKTDRRPAMTTPLWVPVTDIVAPRGADSVKVRVGSSFKDSWILAQICTDRKPVKTEWVKVSEGIVELPVQVPSENERAYVELIGMRDLGSRRARVTVIPYEQSIPLKIEQHTFRDNIEPGSKQSWKFRFSQEDIPAADIPVIAVMTNKALNAIAPFSWQFNPYGSVYRSPVSSLNLNSIWQVGNGGYFDSKRGRYRSYSFVLPEWNLYGYSLYPGSPQEVLATMKTTSLRIRGANTFAAVEESVSDELKEESADVMADYADSGTADLTGGIANAPEMVETGSGANGSSPSGSLENVMMRQVECPLAFFIPDVTSDSDGMATLDFTAPAFVGTWQLQVLGYTPQMKGAVLTLDSRSAKQVMVQMNAPRFVRTGDKMQVSATVYNNSEQARQLNAKIELLNPVSGMVLESEVFDLGEVDASGSAVKTLAFEVPSDINAIQVRAYALGDESSDGEQTVLPVLPSSQPVVESIPFYLKPSAQSFGVKLPKFSPGSKVTLSYCDNPVWECVTALPGMLEPESVNILSKAYALFGNAVASSLFDKYPKLIEGVKSLASDSLLVSHLQTDSELKTVLLNNTPWVNDARSETMRMQSLVEYADRLKAEKSVERMFNEIRDAQLPDGGWSWCPEMKSSSFITASVLHLMAQMKNMDCLPAGGDKLARKAFRYMDDEFARDWNESKRKYFPVHTLLSYLYDKSGFKGINATASFKPLEALAMKEIEQGWRDFDVAGKATAAMLMERSGKPKVARMILESLRQFASVNEQKGMWFANLSGERGLYGDILATSRVLEAYSMIEPSAPAVDMLRQWLVMSKQVQNWGESRLTASAIHALLTTGSDWTRCSSAPEVTLNGLPVSVPSDISVTGSFTVDLDALNASDARLEVIRDGAGPAWGGVLTSYIAPILDVKSASVPQLSIEKNVYAVSTDGKKSSASVSLKKGDRVRVTLTIVCDRDLDYVAVTDPRAACLEPADQLSGYTSTDGVWYYREVRNAQTNLFIPFLSKGTHVISYECFVDREGEYILGVAAAQSQYAPVITAHSGGAWLNID